MLATGFMTRARFQTNQGEFVLDLFDKEMPVTAGNFIKLA